MAKTLTTVRLSDEARQMQQSLSRKLGLSLSATLELAIREMAERKDIKLQPLRAPRGTHATDDLRSAFQAWAEGQWDKTTEIHGERRSIEWLTGKLWNCTDILPVSSCDELDIPKGSTYAQAARHVRETK